MKKLCLLFFILAAPLCFAQGSRGLDFVHTPPKISELPFPGRPVSVSVVLKKELLTAGIRVRALVTRDGRLLEISDNEPEFDSNDRMVFRFEVPSPVSSMSYQFLFQDKLGLTSLSKRYHLGRSCRPDTELTKVSALKTEGITRDSAPLLVSESRGLERDIALYEQVIKLLSDVQSLLEKK